MITNLVIFAFIIGFLSGAVIIAAIFWAKDLGLHMNWWKWLLTTVWWMGFLFAIAVPATFAGEGEPYAGAMMILFSLVPAILGGFIVWRIITADRVISK